MPAAPQDGWRGRLAERKPQMRKSKVSMFRTVRILLGFLLLLAAATVAPSQGTPVFSRGWKLDNERCQQAPEGRKANAFLTPVVTELLRWQIRIYKGA